MSTRTTNQEADRLRGLPEDELQRMESDQMDQLFRLKFQMRMGQTESLKKIRTLRRSVARLKTIRRQHQLGLIADAPSAAAKKAESKPAAKSAKPAAKKTKAKPAAKKTAKSSKKAGKK
jgi:large subunit ribosomal protein L29